MHALACSSAQLHTLVCCRGAGAQSAQPLSGTLHKHDAKAWELFLPRCLTHLAVGPAPCMPSYLFFFTLRGGRTPTGSYLFSTCNPYCPHTDRRAQLSFVIRPHSLPTLQAWAVLVADIRHTAALGCTQSCAVRAGHVRSGAAFAKGAAHHQS
jgi:hypothetical protein